MKIVVEFFGDLRKYLRRGEERLEVEVGEGGTVEDLLRQLGLEEGEVFGASIEGIFVGKDTPLEEGNSVLIFPPIAGG